MTAKQEPARSWFLKASSDLGAVRKLATEPDTYLDNAIYHCQQAGEKAVKGFLVFHGEDPPKTHDIRYLIALASEIHEAFDSWLDVGSRLTAFATEFRYPGTRHEPDREEFEVAFQGAQRLYDFVLSLVPAEERP